MSDMKPLRNGRERVQVVTLNGETRPVLGIRHPQEDRRREEAVRYWGMDAGSPRRQSLESIDEPLSLRSQTILSHEVAPEIARALDAGLPLPDRGIPSRTGKPEAEVPRQSASTTAEAIRKSKDVETRFFDDGL